ncbi:uncharacterized protein BT62DRAFT_1075501 [Guyanagaster necrorhizus]|uniref:Uncharacterized protein n=1 Tax=Guyanagaster necrorhizus TaxID=856835 RepID=A0A9P7VTT2_9AGAR|nr:uncharacterized protein BT62DRAFT_1075501 [Guyanagaster necrorhizus MCA 3950]KAG7446732.1 hypothetical protein BT62DRAFT_1075501 [Guyanagaster necrorhizus MCA 3950]
MESICRHTIHKIETATDLPVLLSPPRQNEATDYTYTASVPLKMPSVYPRSRTMTGREIRGWMMKRHIEAKITISFKGSTTTQKNGGILSAESQVEGGKEPERLPNSSNTHVSFFFTIMRPLRKLQLPELERTALTSWDAPMYAFLRITMPRMAVDKAPNECFPLLKTSGVIISTLRGHEWSI